jgi:hypothetical protein
MAGPNTFEDWQRRPPDAIASLSGVEGQREAQTIRRANMWLCNICSGFMVTPRNHPTRRRQPTMPLDTSSSDRPDSSPLSFTLSTAAASPAFLDAVKTLARPTMAAPLPPGLTLDEQRRELDRRWLALLADDGFAASLVALARADGVLP